MMWNYIQNYFWIGLVIKGGFIYRFLNMGIIFMMLYFTKSVSFFAFLSHK